MTLGKRGNGGGAGRDDLVAYDLTTPQPTQFVLKPNIDREDPLKLPGDVMTNTTGNGVVFAMVSTDGGAVFLEGAGHKENFKPQPFIDRVTIRNGDSSRIFEGSAETFDEPLAALDADVTRLIVQRQGKSMHPDSHLWTKGSTALENLTKNSDPYPEITRAQRVDSTSHDATASRSGRAFHCRPTTRRARAFRRSSGPIRGSSRTTRPISVARSAPATTMHTRH